MDVERALVAKLVRTGAVETTMGLGIEETHFDDPNGDPAKVYRWMVDHVRKYRSAPSIDAFKKQFPNYTLDSVSDSMEYIVDEFVTRTKRREAIKRLEDLATIVDDPVRVKEIEEEFLAAARDMSRVIPGSHASKFSDMEKRIDMYLARKAQENPMGIPFGIKRFDELTFGVQPHELIGIVGWQGTGKSTLLQHFMFNAYVAGYTPMIISLEMEDEALYRKWDVMATQLEYRALKALELNPADEKKWTEAAERAKNAKNDIIVIDNVGRCTVDKVYAETCRYKPDMVGVDYLTLMDAPRSMTKSWEQVRFLSRELKLQARSLKIPIFAVAQTNADSADSGAELSNIGFGKALGMDADIVFGLHWDKDMRAANKMEVRLLKNRDGMLAKALMYWKLSHMEIREWRQGDDMFEVAAPATGLQTSDEPGPDGMYEA